jgi:hypothetical protein
MVFAVLELSIIAIITRIAVIAGVTWVSIAVAVRRRWRGGDASDSTCGTADRSTKGRPGSAASGSSDRRTSTGSKQAAADKTLRRIVRIAVEGAL